ncbi:MAG: TauD/TfdA family dioxygenase, partial [Candidatus Methylomirabilis sp.]|nr:TauD/TfdA family dioxygenase [Deltaproteobacteria bacterium]
VEDWGPEDSALAYWGLGHHLGAPGAQNAQDELLGHVVDYGEERTQPMVRLYRTTSNIDFHCDAADAVGLLCLRTAREGGESRIASSVAVYNEIARRAPDLAARLFGPFMLDRRGEEGPGEPGWVPMQAACYAGGALRTFYHSEYFRSAARFAEGGRLDDRAAALLDLYDALAASPEFRLDMRLAPGDMQFISNHAIVHARTEYRDHTERDRKRHLLRLWLSLD